MLLIGGKHMSNFLNALKEETTVTLTENGAKTYSSSLNSNLDFFGQAGAMRSRLNEVPRLFSDAYAENKELAVRNLIHLRNIRLGGLGERDAYRLSFRSLADTDTQVAVNFVDYIAFIGRWDDVVDAYAHAVKTNNRALRAKTVSVIKETLDADIKAVSEGNSVSLLAKWLPIPSTASPSRRKIGLSLMEDLGIHSNEKGSYRRAISRLRTEIGIVEQKLASKNYDDINFEKLPSKALFQYREAFRRHMPTKYQDYLDSVEKGEAKMNAGTLLPYEILRAYAGRGWGSSIREYNQSLELAWKSLDNVLEGINDNAIVMADVSGSMTGDPMDVSVSLGLYCAERLEGAFKDHFITFSGNPKLVHVPSSQTLKDRANKAYRADWDMSTNLEKAFDLILNTAIKHNTPQNELPSKLIIISDMEFNRCMRGSDITNFENARRKFENAGYKLPDVVFWNVDSRNDNMPVRHDERGVALVSGLTPNIFRQVLGADIVSPEAMMLEVLNSERYDFVSQVFK